MSDKEKGLELKVGLFICIGLLVIAAMIVKFGLGGRGFKSYYDLKVDLPNANGLLKGSEVLLAGARIGFISAKPVLSDQLGTVQVTVRIDNGIKIPKKSLFSVGSSGLLGDKFVDVQTPEGFDPKKFDPADPEQICTPGGAPIKGVASGGLDAITQKGDVVMDELKNEIEKLKVVTDKINDGLLNDVNVRNLQETFANLKTTTANFIEVSQNANKVVTGAQTAVDNTNKTMATINGAGDDLRKVLNSAKGVLQKASQGDGLVAALLTNRELSENLKALVINLRAHGVLFYKDSVKPDEQPSARGGRRR